MLTTNSPGRKYYLHGITDDHAIQFWKKYDLDIEKDVFVKGVLAVRERAKIMAVFEESPQLQELKFGPYKLTELELRVLKNAWTRTPKQTVRQLSRLHWILIVACIFAAITQ